MSMKISDSTEAASTVSETGERAVTVGAGEAESAPLITGRWPGLLARHKVAVAVATVSVVAAIGGLSWGIPAAQKAAADANYQEARVAATRIYRHDLTAQRAWTAAHKTVTDLSGQVSQIVAGSDGYLPAEQRTQLASAARALAGAASWHAGVPVGKPALHGTPESTTDELEVYTRQLTRTTEAATASQHTTAQVTAWSADQSRRAEALLNQVVVGAAATRATKAVPALDADVTAVLTTWAKADQPSKDALTAAVSIAIKGVKDGKPAASLILDYLTNAAAVHAAHDRQVADELKQQQAQQQAAQSGESSYTDPITGAVRPTPSSNSGSTNNSSGSTGSPNNSSGSAGSGSTGGTSTGGGAPAVDKSFRPGSGSKAASCPSGHIASFETWSPYGQPTPLWANWLTYTPSDTGDGWQVDGTYCAS